MTTLSSLTGRTRKTWLEGGGSSMRGSKQCSTIGGRTDQVGEQEEEGGHDSCLVERCWVGRKEDEGGGQGSSYIKTFLWC